jgi:hypothetical protein
MATQFGHDGFVVPFAGTDEILDGLAGAVGGIGNALGSLALQMAEFALDDDLGEVSLFVAVEEGQIAFEESREAMLAAAHVVGGEFRVGQQSLSLGLFEQRHPCPSS